MCGLVGYVGPTAPVSVERLVVMRETLRHRGPDDAGLWTGVEGGASVGLAHRRLAIVDLDPRGRQPMAHGGARVVFNGEIYNHRVLRRALEAEGAVFGTATDTEVIPALYARRGEGLLDELEGMFAFALWDGRRLLLARDRLGVKPLFVAERGESLMFASEPKALRASGVIDDGIEGVDRQALHDYLGLCYVPGPRTLWRGITQLPPGHAMVWEAGRVRRWRWWRPVFAVPRPAASLRVAAAETRRLLCAAVEDRLMADVPLGVFLSGGIDSTAVLWAMREAGARRPAFTIRFAEAGFDESAVAARVAKALGAEHHVETVRPDPVAVVEALAPAMDQPFADSSAIAVWHLCRLARRAVTVALGGDGGDEVFAGYRTHVAWWLARHWRRLPARVRAGVTAAVGRLPVSHGKVSLDLQARAFTAAAARPAVAAHALFKSFLSEEARRALMGSGDEIEPTVRVFEAVARGESLHDILACDLGVYLPDDILVKLDRMSMAHGVEARVPLLDRRLVEAAGRWPAGHKLRGPLTKVALRAALIGRVPAEVLGRRKAGFNVPMARWLSGPLRPLLEELAASPVVGALLDRGAVGRLIAEHRARHRDHSRPLWAMVCLMLSLRRVSA